MNIKCLTTFLDGRDRFEAGDVRSVKPEQASRFVAAGWASSQEAEPAPQKTGATDLTVQNARMGQKVKNG